MAAGPSFLADDEPVVRVLCWNMEGQGSTGGTSGKWPVLRAVMKKTYGSKRYPDDSGDHTIALLQEVGTPPWVVAADLGGLQVYKDDDFWMYVLEFGKNEKGLRVSTGILVHESLIMRSDPSSRKGPSGAKVSLVQKQVLDPKYIAPDDFRRRVLFLRLSPYDTITVSSRYGVERKKNFIWYGTLHAPAFGSDDFKQNYIRDILEKAKDKCGGSFVCGGDYNLEPSRNSVPEALSLKMINPQEGTHENPKTFERKELDYMVYQGGAYGCDGVAPQPGDYSDHGLVRFHQVRG